MVCVIGMNGMVFAGRECMEGIEASELVECSLICSLLIR